MVYGRGKAFELGPDRPNAEKKAGLCVAAAATMASRDDIDKRGHANDFRRQVDVWYRCPFPLVAGLVTQESGTSLEHLLCGLRQARCRLVREPVILEDGLVGRGADRNDVRAANRLSRIRGWFYLNAVPF